MLKMTDSPVDALKQTAIHRLEWAGRFFDSILDSLSDEQLMARAGGAGNSPLWVMGHVAQSSDFIVSALSGKPNALPKRFHELFAGGGSVTNDRSAYPSREELRDAIAKSRTRTIEWVRALNDETAFAPAPEALQPFAPDAISTAFTIVAHDLFHLGQVASVRASLGLAPVHR